MAPANLYDVLHRLARGMDAEMVGQESDQQLVERALGRRDVAGLQAIVHRHGAMVYRVCWRVLRHTQDAEDAFQATFLVLAQQLRTVRKHASLASWLHGVARRVSVKARDQTAARRRRESGASLFVAVPPDDAACNELLSVLDTELSRLPDRWRLPLILCYLEGRTQDEAARRLTWSKSTLRSRLEEARDALARRLSARGITLPAAFSAVLLSECVASSPPSPGLIARTVDAVADVATGTTPATPASATVAALTEGVTKTMFPTKLKTMTAVLLFALGVLGSGGAMIHVNTAGAQPARVAPQQPKADDARTGGAAGDAKKADVRVLLAVAEGAHSTKTPLRVIIENISDHPQSHFKESNSWGYGNVTVEWTDAGGKTGTAAKVPGNFTVNYPGTVTLQPGEALVRDITFDPQLWNGWPEITRGTKLQLKVIYQTVPDPKAPSWTGKVSSKGQTFLFR